LAAGKKIVGIAVPLQFYNPPGYGLKLIRDISRVDHSQATRLSRRLGDPWLSVPASQRVWLYLRKGFPWYFRLYPCSINETTPLSINISL